MATAPLTDTAPSLPPAWRGWYLVTVLSIASIVSFIDRQIINLLVDPIKLDLGISDFQISLLQGFAFALFYAFLAIPLAWVSDRYNRKMVILFGLVCWSAATFASGLASIFMVLFVARMFIGVGEATLAPAGMSMISDMFSKKKLPGPISVYVGSGFVGSGLALTVGGYLYSLLEAAGPQTLAFGTFQPWQLTFFAVAMLSVPVFLMLLTVAEPVRRDDSANVPIDEAPPAFEVLGFLKSKAGLLVPLIVGFSCFSAAQFGIGAWAPSYFIRVHGWSQFEVGAYFGPVVMVSGIAGVVTSGFLAERLLARGMRDATLRLPIIAVLAALPFAIAYPLVASPWLALVLLAIVLFLGTVPFGAGVATFPLITPNRMRAQVIAAYLLVANLLGYSAGPILVAWLTDNVFGDPALINLSLATAPVGMMMIGIVLIIIARGPFLRNAALDGAALDGAANITNNATP